MQQTFGGELSDRTPGEPVGGGFDAQAGQRQAEALLRAAQSGNGAEVGPVGPEQPPVGSVYDRYRELEGVFWQGARAVREEEQLEGHFEQAGELGDVGELDEELTARRVGQLADCLRQLRAARQAEHPLLALRAEYLTACMYSRVDSAMFGQAMLDETTGQEFYQYLKRYGSQFFDVASGGETSEKLEKPGEAFENVSWKVALPEELYDVARQRWQRNSVSALRVARDGVVFVAGSSGHDLSELARLVAVATVSSDELDGRQDAAVRPDQALDYLAALHGRVESQREMLLYGPDYLAGYYSREHMQRRHLSDEGRAGYWHTAAPALDSGQWRHVLELMTERTVSEDHPISMDELYREAPFHQTLVELGVQPDVAQEAEEQVQLFLQGRQQALSRELAPVRDVRLADEADETGKAWQMLFLEPGMKRMLNQEFGVEMTDMSLDAQRQLVGFLAQTGSNEFARLKQVLAHTEGVQKLDFMESFLALEQGATFGESLLTLAERLPQEQLESVLGAVHEIRELSSRIRDRVVGDERVVVDKAQALLRRTTEVLKAAEERVTQGTPVDITVGELPCHIEDFGQLQQQLDVLRLVGQGATSNEQPMPVMTGGEPEVWLTGRSPLTFVVTRAVEAERGRQDKRWEIGKAMRINQLTVVDGEPLPEDISAVDMDWLQRHAVSLRLDFQDDAMGLDIGGKVMRAAGQDASGSPKKELDPSAPDWQLAEVVTVGAALHARDRQAPDEDYHVYGLTALTPAEFAAQVRAEREDLQARWEANSMPPGPIGAGLPERIAA